MTATVRQATRLDVAEFLGTLQACYVAELAGELVAMGTFTRHPDGRLFVQMEVRSGQRLGMFWQLRTIIAQSPRPLYAACEDLRYPAAPKFLTLLGFEKTAETWAGKPVWMIQ